MWHWRVENFNGLRDIASQVAGEPGLIHFGEYCSLREQGLRQQAFAALNKFLATAEFWDVQRRRAFVRWLVETHAANPSVFDLIPHPLQEKLVTPTIRQWQVEAPNDPLPFQLGGDYESLKTAIHLDPTHQRTLLRLIKLLWGHVSMACHELPAGVIGETSVVLADLSEVENLLSFLLDASERNAFARVSEFREVVQNYANYLADNVRTKSFEDWAISRGLKCIAS